jgi:hypothetical protein
MGMNEAWDNMQWGPSKPRVSARIWGLLSLKEWVKHTAKEADALGKNFTYLGGGIYVTTNKHPSASGATYYQVAQAEPLGDLCFAKGDLYFGTDLDAAKAAIDAATRLPPETQVRMVKHDVEIIWEGDASSAPPDQALSISLDGVPVANWLETCGDAGRERLNSL